MKYSIEQAGDIASKSVRVRSVELIGRGNHSEAFCVNDEMIMITGNRPQWEVR